MNDWNEEQKIVITQVICVTSKLLQQAYSDSQMESIKSSQILLFMLHD